MFSLSNISSMFIMFLLSSFRYIFDVFKVLPNLLLVTSPLQLILAREEDETNVVESEIAQQFLERSPTTLSLLLIR